MVQIEKGVPLPTGKGRVKSRKQVLDIMEVGDSFRVPPDESTAWKSAANTYGKNGRKYSVRIFEGGYRLWRIE